MLIFLLLAAIVLADYVDYASVKPQIRFPRYTPAERLQVVDQAEMLLKIYVNRESKMRHYGPSVDPLPKMVEMRRIMNNLTDHDFHVRMSSIFTNLHDRHANYYFPRPYSCYEVIWPIEMTLAESHTPHSPLVVVKSISTVKQVLDLAPEVARHVAPGDIVRGINKKSFAQLFAELSPFTSGANQYGSMRSVLAYLAARHGYSAILPNETTVEYMIQKPSGALINVRANLSAQVNKLCLKEAEHEEKRRNNRDGPVLRIDSVPRRFFNKSQLDNFAVPPVINFRSLFRNGDIDLRHAKRDNIIIWDVLNFKGYKLGFFKFETFLVQKPMTPRELLLKFRNILINEMKDTDALLIDVRDNGGGSIPFVESIPQFFVEYHKTHFGRALIGGINSLIYLEEEMRGTEWYDAYSNPDGSYSKPVKFISNDEANKFGMAYFKSVAVLTNALCYSACEIFTAGMQDSEAAFVFGEDPSTGGGGANGNIFSI